MLSTSCLHVRTGKINNMLVELMETCIDNRQFRYNIKPSQALGQMHLGSYSDDATLDGRNPKQPPDLYETL